MRKLFDDSDTWVVDWLSLGQGPDMTRPNIKLTSAKAETDGSISPQAHPTEQLFPNWGTPNAVGGTPNKNVIHI